ncbi:EVE domain-containing protein [Priestia megaterium]|uniref:EVE domain-containing protein n=1 Tax=Priestia megaterium TaxID=1404 RepID=UPI001C2215D6|nr:EVE domain-containing protein [Priestia megaterium]MBU8689490.1 EVE domain-containing protein [Priestia megaterium]
MNTWIFQGNPTRFNVDGYILENKTIWWSIRQDHLAEHIQLGDEVFIWRSDGDNKGSGGIISRTEVITLPQDYTNDDESAAYWYEDVSDKSYLAIKLRVLEVDVEVGINRIELTEHPKLKDLMILRLRQNTNYLVNEKHKTYLKHLWYSRYAGNVEDITTRFPLNENDYVLPSLDSNGRVREYNFYSDELKGQVIYEHLINNKTHRWMDINVLGREGNTNGRDSANILYYLGLRAAYRGIFAGKTFDSVIEILKRKGEDYADIVRLLKVQAKSIQLYKSVRSDIEAQELEEGNGIEGIKKSYHVNKYERDPKNRKKAIEIHGLNCYVCGFNFEEVYGERGRDFIEIHHIKPLSSLKEAVAINPKTDLVPLCANCHRMIHRRKNEVLTVEQLKALTKKLYTELENKSN